MAGELDEQLFSQQERKPSAKAAPVQPPAIALQQGALAAKLKITEERYRNLHKRNKMNEEALLALENDLRMQVRVLTRQVVELRRQITMMSAKIDGMTGELSSVVRKHELAVLERYIDLWDPTRFVSRDEAKRIIEEARDG